MTSIQRQVLFVFFWAASLIMFLSWNFRETAVAAKGRAQRHIEWSQDPKLKAAYLEAKLLRDKSKLKSFYDKGAMSEQNYLERLLLIERDYGASLKEDDQEKAFFWQELITVFKE